MSSLPAEPVLRASRRWVDLLLEGDLARARGMISSNAAMTDLTTTQYAFGLELLRRAGLCDGAGQLNQEFRALPTTDRPGRIAQAVLSALRPPWLLDVQESMLCADDLPSDTNHLAVALALTDEQLWDAVRVASVKVNVAEREEVGRAGELELVGWLEQLVKSVPSARVRHVAQESDAYGYDIAVEGPGWHWHIEVKATRSRARLVMYLTRNEFETAKRDAAWQLVAVALNGDGRMCGVGSVGAAELASMVPMDVGAEGSWEVARVRPSAGRLVPGLPFLETVLPPGTQFTIEAPVSGHVWWLHRSGEGAP